MSHVDFHCPHCKKRVSVLNSLAGRASACPACQEWLKVPTKSEPGLEPLAQGALLDTLAKQELEPVLALGDGPRGMEDSRGHVALGGWSCLVIALLLMVFARPAFFVYLPLAVVAFVLGIVTMAKGHVFRGQLLLIGTLVLPVLVAMKFLGLELSQVPHLDQWMTTTPNAKAMEVAEEATSELERPVSDRVESPTLTPAVARSEWTAQETAMEATFTSVESDWDQEMLAVEPNWADREDYWADQYLGRFVAPQAGMYVKLTLQSGGGAEGTLRAVGPESVTLQVPSGWVTYEKARLAPESRRKFFAEDFARHYAARKVRGEQEQFQWQRGRSGDGMSSRY